MDYFNKTLVVNEISSFQAALADPMLSADAIPSDAIGRELIQLADRMLTGPNFRGYPLAIKQDMKGRALLDMTKALTKFDLTKAESVFGYFTRVCWFAFLQTIQRFYKNLNLQRKLYAEELRKNGILSEKEIAEMLSRNFGTGVAKTSRFNRRKTK